MSREQKLNNEAGRVLGNCQICDKLLVEYCSYGIYCYNEHDKTLNQIVFVKMGKDRKPIYKCRTCSSENEKKRHDITF
jgi:hypothetical protein